MLDNRRMLDILEDMEVRRRNEIDKINEINDIIKDLRAQNQIYRLIIDACRAIIKDDRRDLTNKELDELINEYIDPNIKIETAEEEITWEIKE